MDSLIEWYQETSKKMGERNAAVFILATVNSEGQPSTRTMLAKAINTENFSFIGNLHTQKFEELKKNPHAAITFNWLQDQRQINLIGAVEPLTADEAEKIFRDRAPSHQVSSLLFGEIDKTTDYKQLRQKHEALSKRYKNKSIPVPSTWGGFRFIPQKIEFWQCGSDNMHSRIVYTKDSKGVWMKAEIISS